MLLLWSLYFNGKDEAGVEKNRDNHYHEQKAELFIGLAKCEDETLESSKVSHHLEDPHDSHDPQQSDDLSRLANNFQVLQTKHDRREEKRRDSQEVNHIHFVTNKSSFPRTDEKSGNIVIRLRAVRRYKEGS